MVVGYPPNQSTDVCEKCGVGFSILSEEDEIFRCVYCGWRKYGSNRRERSAQSMLDGKILRLRYVGPNLARRRWQPLEALMVNKHLSRRSSKLGLLITCPICLVDGQSYVMDACDGTERRWVCPAVGHSIELHIGESRDLLGWS